MKLNHQKYLWMAIAAGTGLIAGEAVRNSLKQGWRTVRREDPPENPAAETADWPSALAWAMVTGMAVGIARVIAQRGMAAGWRKATGRKPPGV